MMNKINKWIELNPFWAESIRTIFFSFIGTIVAIFVINQFQNRLNYNWDKKKARLNIQLDAINSFINASYDFTSRSVRYKEKSISYSEIRDKFDLFRITLHILKINCISLDTSLNRRADLLSKKMIFLINNRDNLATVKIGDSDEYENLRIFIKNESDSIIYRLNSAIDKQD